MFVIIILIIKFINSTQIGIDYFIIMKIVLSLLSCRAFL